MKIATVMVLLLILILVACSGVLNNIPVPDRTPAPKESLQATPSDATTQTSTNGINSQSPDQALIVLRRSGGIAGVDEVWKIYPNGQITNNDDEVTQIEPERITQLIREIEEAGFFGFKSEYTPLNACCDRFTYEISVSSNGKSHTVRVLEGDSQAPKQLWGIIQSISEAVTKP